MPSIVCMPVLMMMGLPKLAMWRISGTWLHSPEPILNAELPNVPERFQTDTELVTTSELEPTFENEQTFTNVHAFSYLGHNVGLNQRTVNESAAVVIYLSRFGAR